MQYFGGKYRIRKEICEVLNSFRKDGQIFVEPFVGGANIVSNMLGERHAYDKHYELIELYKEVQLGWIPPTSVDENEYIRLKNSFNSDESALRAFVGFGCSFAGKYFGGFARSNKHRDYAKCSSNLLLTKSNTLYNVVFKCEDYINLSYQDVLIYCDPPYQGTTAYQVGDFDSEQFWEVVRNWSKTNTVIISEYDAPDDFECIWSKPYATSTRNNLNKRVNRIEKLFKLKQ